ncbi:MAG: hypothetical protein JNL28_03635, partial [Planctomycetes bacterium]|nr:hypothetical protein [Planctomycetota bacterium]
MIRTTGRALGGGRLLKEKRGNGPPRWVLDYKGADGVRRRQALSIDRRVAERMRIEIISQRDLQMAGLATVEGQSRLLSEIQTIYIADMETRVSQSHLRNVRARIDRVLAGVRVQRVRDLLPHHLIEWRTKRIAAKAGHRTVNHEILNVKSMLTWAVQAGLIHQNPIESLKSLPVAKHHIK